MSEPGPDSVQETARCGGGGRAFLLQSGLRNGSTHFLQETQGWFHNLKGHFVEPVVLGHEQWQPAIAPDLPVGRVFRRPPDTDMGSDPRFLKLQTLIEGGAIFAADCAALDAAEPGPGDLVIVPYATDVEVLGLALWGSRRRARGAALPFAVAILHRPDFAWQWNPAEGGLSGDLSHLAYALHRLEGAFGQQGHAAVTTTEALAGALRDRVPGRIVAGCAPNSYPPPADPAGTVLHDVAFLGQLRPEKGSRQLAAIVRGLLDAAPATRFAVQLDGEGNPAGWLDDFEAVRDDPRVRWLHGALDEAAYTAALAQSACVVIPYHPERYRLRVSGVFCDALAAGCPVVVPAGTWMTDMLERGYGAGVAVRSPAPEAYVKGLLRLAESLPAATAQARARAPAWRADQSIERLVEIVVGLHRAP